jgi:hypothetical protein
VIILKEEVDINIVYNRLLAHVSYCYHLASFMFELLSLARVVYAAIVSALSRSCCGFVLPALTLVIENVVIGTERGPGALEEEFVFVFGQIYIRWTK